MIRFSASRFFHRTNLTTLYVGYNGLSELPIEIGKLTNLTTLHIGWNELTELPKEIAQLTNLSTLEVGFNALTELPRELINLTHLTVLDISVCSEEFILSEDQKIWIKKLKGEDSRISVDMKKYWQYQWEMAH